MFAISTLGSRFKSGRRHERSAARPCAEILEGRELMAAFGGHGFAFHAHQAARMAALHARQAHVMAFRHLASPVNGPAPGHVVSNPGLISPVDPMGQFQTRAATTPAAAPAAATPAPGHIVSDPSLISPVDPYGQFKTR